MRENERPIKINLTGGNGRIADLEDMQFMIELQL
jgi:hypothetical protein